MLAVITHQHHLTLLVEVDSLQSRLIKLVASEALCRDHASFGNRPSQAWACCGCLRHMHVICGVTAARTKRCRPDTHVLVAAGLSLRRVHCANGCVTGCVLYSALLPDLHALRKRILPGQYKHSYGKLGGCAVQRIERQMALRLSVVSLDDINAGRRRELCSLQRRKGGGKGLRSGPIRTTSGIRYANAAVS